VTKYCPLLPMNMVLTCSHGPTRGTKDRRNFNHYHCPEVFGSFNFYIPVSFGSDRSYLPSMVGFFFQISRMLISLQWISGFTALPPIYNRLTTTAAQNGAYWLPQVIGGTGFIVSGTLFMLETQQKWYLPAYQVLGWHIGVWNLIGVGNLLF